MVTSPNLRFGYVYLLFLVSTSFCSLIYTIFTFKKKETDLGKIMLRVILVFLVLIIIKSFDVATIKMRIILPLDYAHRSTFPCEINDGRNTVFCASEWGECSYHAFPCHAWGNDNVLMYGKNFSEGFYPSK